MSSEFCTRVRDAASLGPVLGNMELEGHAKDCAACARELAEYKKRSEFRDAFPELTSLDDESEHRRRPRLKVPASFPRVPARRLLLLITAVVATFGYFTRNRVTGDISAIEGSTSGPPNFRIFNLENALFETKTEGDTVRASLTRGVAAFFVQRLGPGQHFLVTVPDGELDSRCTRFVIEVEGGKTQYVEVNQGTVELRREGHEKMALTEGQRWRIPGASRPTLSFVSPTSREDAGPPGAASVNH